LASEKRRKLSIFSRVLRDLWPLGVKKQKGRAICGTPFINFKDIGSQSESGP
jgi:hypothetical protein